MGKYEKIFSLEENLYAEGSPLIIKAGALLKDNDTSWLIAQLKLSNISNNVLKYAKVEISCLDSLNRPIGEPVMFEYLDLSAYRGQDFGTQTPIKIVYSAARSYTVRLVEAGFSDNTIWSNPDAVWQALPKQEDLTTAIADDNAQKGYKETFGQSANFIACDVSGGWLCSCGEFNHENEERCYKCNASHSDLLSCDYEELKKYGIYVSACEIAEAGDKKSLQTAISELEKIEDYKDASQIKQEYSDKLYQMTYKKKRATKISVIAASAVVAIGLLSYFVLYPMSALKNGDYTVYINMYNIKSYEIPDGVTSIGNLAFYDCDSLTSITIPDSVTSIGNSAFSSCYGLTSITIPDSVTSIGNSAFSGCGNLTSITIPDSVTSIGSRAFSSCYDLTSITIPDSVTTIGDEAFYWCDSLTSITIPDSVTSIGDEAFYNCRSLTSITIPDSVTSIGDYAFAGCGNLKSIYYEGTIKQWKSLYGYGRYGYTVYCSDGKY